MEYLLLYQCELKAEVEYVEYCKNKFQKLVPNNHL